MVSSRQKSIFSALSASDCAAAVRDVLWVTEAYGSMSVELILAAGVCTLAWCWWLKYEVVVTSRKASSRCHFMYSVMS